MASILERLVRNDNMNKWKITIMVSLPIYDRTGKQVDTYELDVNELAGEITQSGKQLMHDAVVMYQSNARQGTAKTKTRGEVAGSTKKMYK